MRAGCHANLAEHIETTSTSSSTARGRITALFASAPKTANQPQARLGFLSLPRRNAVSAITCPKSEPAAAPWRKYSAALLLLLCLLGGPSLAAAQSASCLAVSRPQRLEQSGDVCSFRGAILNRCGQDVRYVIVRPVPDPERGPLPTVTGTIGRFQLAPLAFDRELCQQGHHILEVAGDGALRDVTGEAISPPPQLDAVEQAASRVNACVKTCAPPILDRSEILTGLRAAYGKAVDAPDAAPALDEIVSLTIADRRAKDQVCASICQGRLTADRASAETSRIEAESQQTLASPLAALQAIAARPAPPPPPVIVDAQPDEKLSAPPRRHGRGKHRVRSAGAGRCQNVGANGRCRLVLNITPRSSTKTKR